MIKNTCLACVESVGIGLVAINLGLSNCTKFTSDESTFSIELILISLSTKILIIYTA